MDSQIPKHPDVRLKQHLFYDVLHTLIKPTTLMTLTSHSFQEMSFDFTLTPEQATEIILKGGEPSVQVQLRFCAVETSCDQEDCLPNIIYLGVNNKYFHIPDQSINPNYRKKGEPKYLPSLLNVTPNVNMSPGVQNTILVQWRPDKTHSYCLTVNLVKQVTSSDLLQRMKNKGANPVESSRAFIKEKLTADGQITTPLIEVSLTCPVGQMKMSLPCRATTCTHFQCFDADPFLRMNERKATWKCPVCGTPVIYSDLVIDGYFLELLNSSLLCQDDTAIHLHQDGSWSRLNAHGTKPMGSVLSPSTSNCEIVDLTLSYNDDYYPRPKRAKQAAATTTSTSNGTGGP